MSATASRPSRLLLPCWWAFASANAALMYVLDTAQTIPFHFVWVSTALVYGLRPWRLPYMWLTCLAVTVVTGIPLVRHAAAGDIGWEETSEIPLMALLFLVMVWHVRRRMAASAEATRLAEEERRSRETQRRFVRFASHELRTPITVARGFTELVRREHIELAANDDIDVILEELDKLEGVAARLLTLAQADDAPLHVQQVDVVALLERTARRWKAAAPTRTWVVESADIVITADPVRLEVAIDSIVENAVRHTHPGGSVILRSRVQGAEAFLEVADDGAGIAAHELPLVFEGFHSSGPHAGTGLGLAIVKAVAEAHRGRVSATNGPTSGAVIALALPYLRQPRSGARRPTQPSGKAAQGVPEPSRTTSVKS
jgi:two-component system OmpR family sensor kinase